MAAAVSILRFPFFSLSAFVGTALFGLVAAAALGADLLCPGDPMDMVARPNLWPGSDARFPLGTDMLGRDLWTGLVHGARVSLLVGFSATLLALAIGTAVGLAGGYFGGVADDATTRLTEMVQTIPGFLFTIVLVVILSPSVHSIAFSVGVTFWPQVARLVRAEVLRVRESVFVKAAVVTGLGHGRILLAHVLPNVLSPVVVAASVLVANAILLEASLSFLGLGDPSVVSWGGMIGAGREQLRTAWYMAALPGAAIIVTVVGITLLGNALNDRLNPRTAARDGRRSDP